MVGEAALFCVWLPITQSLWLDEVSQRKGAKDGKEKFIVFISVDLVNLRLEQQDGKSWWPELILLGLSAQACCMGSQHCILLWRVEFQFQVWSTAWASTFSNTQKKPISTKSNLKCFLIDFVSLTQAGPHNPPVSASSMLRLQVWVTMQGWRSALWVTDEGFRKSDCVDKSQYAQVFLLWTCVWQTVLLVVSSYEVFTDRKTRP